MIETNFRLKSTSLIKKIFVKLFLRGNSDYVSGYERRVNYCSLDLTHHHTYVMGTDCFDPKTSKSCSSKKVGI